MSVSPKTHPDLFVESDTPQPDQKHRGWYWHYETGKYYRWDNIPKSSDFDLNSEKNRIYNQN